MNNKGLIITLIILFSIIIFFLVMFLVMCLNGRMTFKHSIFSVGNKSTNIIYDKQFKLEDINDIDIIQDAGVVLVKETTEDNIKVVLYGENEGDANVELDNGKLTIDNTHSRKSFVLFNFGVSKNNIIVYIPSNYSENIKIKNDCGECEIADLENASIDMNCDAGNVELGKIKNANIKCDDGNIQIKEVLNKCDIKADCGNIEIDTISIKEDSNIKADLGNVSIFNTNDIYIDSDVDLGETNINKNNRNAEITLKIECDCGNVTVSN